MPYQAEMWALAHETAKFSKDPSTKVGAVATLNKRVIGTGRNGFPPGIPDDMHLYADRRIKTLLVNHAEENLIAICGDQIRGGDVFVTFPVCNDCAGLLITAGVKRVFTSVIDNPESEWFHRWNLSVAMFECVGIETYELRNNVFHQCYSEDKVNTFGKGITNLERLANKLALHLATK